MRLAQSYRWPAVAGAVASVLVIAAASPAFADDTESQSSTPLPALTPFDVGDPAVGRLDPRLLGALQAAAIAAGADGVAMTVTSGWRSPEFQQHLLDQAVATYGSFAAARQYVQTPVSSKHVRGEAVDIGGDQADLWLQDHGAQYGLCQVYANEVWHFELTAGGDGICPPMLANAAS